MTAPAAPVQGLSQADMDDWVRDYAVDSRRFVREVFGVTPDPWQDGVLLDYDRGERRISVRSGHGVGKTTGLAWMAVHHVLFRFPQKTVCTAPTSDQLFDALAAEIKAWIGKLPEVIQRTLEIKSDLIELRSAPHESFISFRTARPEKPEAIAGIHSDHVLIIGDEASGIPDPIFEAGAGSMSGHNATTVLAGNPVRSSGLFYETHTRLRDLWRTHHVSCVDSPRVSSDFVEDMKRRYGERSNAYRVRVQGEFPLADDDTIIPFELIEPAYKRDMVPSNVRALWGLDVARFGNDASALAKRRGNTLQAPVKTWHGLDLMELCGRVKAEYDHTPPADQPEEILVDSIGLGSGVVDRLRELKLPVRGVNVSESPALGERYRNLRTELWFRVREWFEARSCHLANDEALGAELMAVKYKFTSSGKMMAESKDDMKKRGLASPDRADAFCLTFAADAASLSAQPGLASRAWSQPLGWKVRGIV